MDGVDTVTSLESDLPRAQSNLTKNNWEIHMDAGVLQLYHSLRYKVLLDSLELGPFPPVLCHNCLFIELMGQVTILVNEQRASSSKHEWGRISETSESCQGLLASLFGCLLNTS